MNSVEQMFKESPSPLGDQKGKRGRPPKSDKVKIKDKEPDTSFLRGVFRQFKKILKSKDKEKSLHKKLLRLLG